jgi:hypothetical protein
MFGIAALSVLSACIVQILGKLAHTSAPLTLAWAATISLPSFLGQSQSGIELLAAHVSAILVFLIVRYSLMNSTVSGRGQEWFSLICALPTSASIIHLV